MNIKNLLLKSGQILHTVPRAVWYIGATALIFGIYALIFFTPKPLQFSYAGESCTRQLVLAPDMQRVESEDFAVRFEKSLQIGSFRLATKQVCITPVKAPQSGTSTIAFSPFGGVFAQKTIAVAVPTSPSIKEGDVIGRSISTALPLKISLSSRDTIHAYSLQIADKTAPCTPDGVQLSCDIASLHLDHGTAYDATLFRAFKQEKQPVVEGEIQTLQPLLLISSSVENGQIVYDMPTHFQLMFDQPLATVEVTLAQKTDEAGATLAPIALKKTLRDTTLEVTFDELARNAQFQLEVTQATAQNGRSLAAPITTAFSTSGGPKVASVSVGEHSVPRAARIILTFDQPIDNSLDLTKFVHVEGVGSSIARQSDAQLAIAIQGGDCAAFTLVVDKGLKSGVNNEVSQAPWRFASRTICGSVWSIGTSRQGRPIPAYSFGGGAKTILFTGGMHGSEPSGYATMLAWAQYLQAHGDIVPADKRVVIVPNTNPDGIAAGSRNNSQNVNIDRNFPTANWKAAIETASGILPTGGGETAGSEPETAALMALTRQLRPRLEVSFHAQGRLVGANKFADSVAIGNAYASIVGYATMFYNAEAVMGYPMTGEYEDWMGEELGVPAVLVELPTSGGNYLTAHLAALRRMLAV